MAAAYRAHTTVDLGTFATNTAFDKPTGTAAGDIILIIMSAGHSPAVSVTAPSGFSTAAGFPVTYDGSGISDSYTIKVYAFYKIADGTEGSTFTTSHLSADTQGICYAISGADQTTPLNPNPTTSSHNGGGTGHNTLTATGLTTNRNDSLVIWWGFCWDAWGATSPPSGTTPTFTERFNNASLSCYFADGVLATAGATGNKSVTGVQLPNGDRPHAQGLIAVDAAAGGGGPTTYNQTCTATLTSSGALTKQCRKTLAGTMTSSGSLTKRCAKAFTATVTSSAALTKQAQKAFTGTVTSAASLVKQAGKVLTGTVPSSASLSRQTTHLLTAVLAPSADVNKRTARSLTAALTSSASLTAIKTALVSLTATLGISATLSKRTDKQLSASLTPTGTVTRFISRALDATLAISATLNKRTSRALSAVWSFVATLVGTTTVVTPPQMIDIVDERITKPEARSESLTCAGVSAETLRVPTIVDESLLSGDDQP